MKNKNIVLVGFMGSGKSMVASKLAGKLNWELISTDALIEKREGRKIADIFENEGEAYFRQVERAIIKEIKEKENVVIDCGGGIVIQQENIDDLKKKGILFFLSATPEDIFQRVKDQKHRPLLSGDHPEEKIRQLLKQRRPFYAQADHTVDTSSQTIEQIVTGILGTLSDE